MSLIDKQKEEKTGTSGELEKVLRQMEKNGILINRKKLSDLAVEIDKKLDLIEKKIFKSVGHEFNLNSPKQLAVVLYDELHLEPERTTRTKTHKSTNEATLSTLTEAHPVIKFILTYRELFHLKSTYVVTLLGQT